MSLDYVRKIVSGKKARFVDPDNSVNLDLVYVTDRIIIMGYPATGVSALYRNRRRDVLKFLDSRHEGLYHVWNLCPLYENAYSPESMHNRVSRYPFPDHHPPPLPLLPLAVREITAWLEGNPERIAIIHCKAGKGRSGTLLCSYMLSLSSLPPPPQIDRNYTHHDLVRRLKDRETRPDVAAPQEGWIMVGTGHDVEDIQVSPANDGSSSPAQSDIIHVSSPSKPVPRSTNSSTTTLSHPSGPPSIQIAVDTDPPFEPIDVGDEADPAAQGQRDRLDGKVDDVFRLHSSRRMKPSSTGRGVSIPSQRRWCRYVNLLCSRRAPSAYLHPGTSRVQVKSVTMLLQPPSGWQKPIASLVLGHGGSGKGKAWASVARYDDEYVAELRRRGGSGEGVEAEITWGGVGGNGSFDTKKMFRSCGKLVEDSSGDDGADENGYHVHHLEPRLPDGSSSLILDSDREFRLKLHLGSLPLGWLWLIPAFHLPDPSETSGVQRMHTLTFARSQLDFAIGPGSAVHQVIVRLEEVSGADDRGTAPLMTSEEEDRTGYADDRGEQVREDGE